MKRKVNALLSAGGAAGLLWVLWQMRDVFPGEFELQIIGAIAATFVVIWLASSGGGRKRRNRERQRL